jgi:peptide/nickel transport system substrate-binding protein
VLFHNGREMTATDVEYSLNRILDPESGSVRASDLGPVAGVNVVDAYTVEIVMSESFAPLLAALSGEWCAVVPREVVEENGDLKKVAVGTGPFMLEEWILEDHLTLIRNPDYWEAGLPYLDKVIFRPMPDEVSRITALTTETVDLLMSIPAREIERLEALDNVTVFGGSSTIWTFVGFYHNKPPFDNLKVRQAVAMAVDRQSALDIAWGGAGRVSTCGPLGTDFWYGCDDVIFPPEGDVEEARRLLAEAGYPDGFSTTIKVPADYSFHVAEGQLVQAALEEIGIEVEYIGQEWGTHSQDKANGDMELFIGGYIGFIDPDPLFYGVFHTDGGFNHQGWSDPVVDALLESAKAETNQEVRAILYKEVSRRLAEQVAAVFLCNPGRYGAQLVKVKGFERFANDRLLSLKYTWIAK